MHDEHVGARKLEIVGGRQRLVALFTTQQQSEHLGASKLYTLHKEPQKPVARSPRPSFAPAAAVHHLSRAVAPRARMGAPNAAVAAYAAGGLGFSVNAQGFLVFYVLGAIKLLGDLGLLGPESALSAAGTSSLVAAAVCSKAPYGAILSSLHGYMVASAAGPFMQTQQRREALRKAADTMLPVDAHTLCSGKVLLPPFGSRSSSSGAAAAGAPAAPAVLRNGTAPGALHIAPARPAVSVQADVFASRAALLAAIVDSTFPAAAAPAVVEAAAAAGPASGTAAAVHLAHELGAASGYLPACHAGAKYCVRLTSVPPAPLGSSGAAVTAAWTSSDDDGSIVIDHHTSSRSKAVGASSSGSSSSSSSSSSGSMHGSAALAVSAAASKAAAVVGAAVETGTKAAVAVLEPVVRAVHPQAAAVRSSSRSDAAAPAAGEAAAAAAVVAAASAAAPAFSAAAAAASIYPGLSQPLALPWSEWMGYVALPPPSPQVLSYMHYLGRVDAYVWANATGLVAAAASEQTEALTETLLRRITSVDAVDELFRGIVAWPAPQAAAVAAGGSDGGRRRL